MDAAPNTHVLTRARPIIELYMKSCKCMEYEFGDQTKKYNVGDTLILYNDLLPTAVRASIADVKLIDRKDIEALREHEIQSIGASDVAQLKQFIEMRDRRGHLQDTILTLENIELCDRMALSSNYPEIRSRMPRNR